METRETEVEPAADEELSGGVYTTSLKSGNQSVFPEFSRAASGARSIPILDHSGIPTGETQLIDEDLTTVAIALAASFFYRFALRTQWTVLPYYGQKFGASPTQIGTLFAVSNVTMVPTTLFIGRFSDRYGRRIALLLAVGGIFFVWSFAGLAWDYWSLLVARILVGFCMGSTPIVVAIIKDMFDDSKIPQYIGYATLLGSIAKILGPPIASGMSQFSLRAPLFAAAIINLFGTVLVYWFVRETNQSVIDRRLKKDDDLMDDDDDQGAIEGDSSFSSTDRSSDNGDSSSEEQIPVYTWQIMFIYYGFFICGFASGLTLSMLALYLEKEYNTGSVVYGFYLLGLELVSTAFLTFGYPFLVYMLGVYSTLICMLVINGLGYLIIALDEWSVWVAVVGAGVAVLGQNVLRPSLQVMLSYAIIDTTRSGNIFAISMAVFSAGSVVSPLLSGPLFSVSPKLPFWVGAGVMASTALAVQIARWFGLEAEIVAEEDDELTDEEFAAKSPKRAPITLPQTEDFHRLGTWLGTMLTEREYDWIPNYAQLQQTLQRVFPAKLKRLTSRASKGISLINRTTIASHHSVDPFALQRMTTTPDLKRATLKSNGMSVDTRFYHRHHQTLGDLADYEFDPNLALQANSAALM